MQDLPKQELQDASCVSILLRKKLSRFFRVFTEVFHSGKDSDPLNIIVDQVNKVDVCIADCLDVRGWFQMFKKALNCSHFDILQGCQALG
jgi:hypothetical protein